MANNLKILLKVIYLLTTIVVLVSCSARKKYNLSKFSYNQRSYNSLIKNRIPKYGNGLADGCIIMSEMNLIMEDSARNYIRGVIKDVATSEPLVAAHVLVRYADSTLNGAYTDKYGKFTLSNGQSIREIDINCLGYRRLWIFADKHSFVDRPKEN